MYPQTEPLNTGFLDVGDGHTLYWEESGHPLGLPVVFLHGGPGSRTFPKHRRFFDPERYRIVLFDQRGCGKSTPHASLHCNTTWDLVSDIEKLRQFLGIESWVVFGGSWGSTLSLAYAIHNPEKVKALILRGIFLGRKKELHWFYQFGAHHIFTDEWDKYLEPIPNDEREDLIRAYYKRLTSPDPATRKKAAKAWTIWETVNLRLLYDPELFAEFTEDAHADALARVECHYFLNQCFFKTDNWLIENLDTIRHIPARIIHGRYDLVCPFESAWELHKAWPESKLEIIPDAGHSASEPGIERALIQATDYFGNLWS
ncbi:MAG TPA: prolyl aminopeptidase [Chlamydiales bacterium]|nr:prolyl aminopeptidase [Chlamydiales bacterium]